MYYFLQRHLSESQQACICWSEGIWVTRLPSNCPVDAQYNLIKDFWRKLETTFSVSLLWSHFCKRNTYTHTHTKYRSVEHHLVCSQFSNHISTRCGFVCLSKSLLSKILHRSHCQLHNCCFTDTGDDLLEFHHLIWGLLLLLLLLFSSNFSLSLSLSLIGGYFYVLCKGNNPITISPQCTVSLWKDDDVVIVNEQSWLLMIQVQLEVDSLLQIGLGPICKR